MQLVLFHEQAGQYDVAKKETRAKNTLLSTIYNLHTDARVYCPIDYLTSIGRVWYFGDTMAEASKLEMERARERQKRGELLTFSKTSDTFLTRQFESSVWVASVRVYEREMPFYSSIDDTILRKKKLRRTEPPPIVACKL